MATPETTLTPTELATLVDKLELNDGDAAKVVTAIRKATAEGAPMTHQTVGEVLIGLGWKEGGRSSNNPFWKFNVSANQDPGKQLKNLGIAYKFGKEPSWIRPVLIAAAAAPVAIAAAPVVAGAAASGAGSAAFTWGSMTLGAKAALFTGTVATSAAIGQIPIDEEKEAKDKAVEKEDKDEAAKPKTPEQAAAEAEAGTGRVKTVIVDESTGVETEITGPEGTNFSDDILKFLAQSGQGGTFTAKDQNYMTATGVNPLDPAALAATGQDIDTQGIFWEQGKRFESANNRAIQGEIAAGNIQKVGQNPGMPGMNRYRAKKTYSYREAVNLPMTLDSGEVMEWSKKLWEGGFLRIEGYDFTKTFESQWSGDRYDPSFRQAFNEMLQVSTLDPSKSATDILDERRRNRGPLLMQARADAMEAKTKEAIKSLRLPDPATLNETAEAKMQALLGRNPTAEERQHLMTMMSQQIGDQAKRVIAGEQVSSEIDYAARMEDAIEQEHGTEYGAARVADQFDMFKSLLGGL